MYTTVMTFLFGALLVEAIRKRCITLMVVFGAVTLWCVVDGVARLWR